MPTINQYPRTDADWATICRWEDAGRPDLNPDGTWEQPAPSADLEEAQP